MEPEEAQPTRPPAPLHQPGTSGVSAFDLAAAHAQIASLEQKLRERESALRSLQERQIAGLQAAEAELRGLLWSRRYRLANLLATFAQRYLPAGAWRLLGWCLRRLHGPITRQHADAVQPTLPPAFARLAPLLGERAWDYAPGSGRPRPRILFVYHEDSGGMPQTSADTVQGLGEEVEAHLLLCDGRMLEWARKEGNTRLTLARLTLAAPLSAARTSDPEYRAFVAQHLHSQAIDLVHIRHLAAHGFDLPELAAAQGLPLVLSLHDYHLLCPTIQLLDERDHFCAGHCTQGSGTCRLPTRWAGALPPLKHAYVYRWREEVRSRVLQHAHACVTTSSAARDIMLGVYPELAARFVVIPHGRDLPTSEAALPPRSGERLRLLVLGELTPAKGGGLVRELVRRDRGQSIEWHFLGALNREYAGLGIEHGRYAREELPQRLAQIRPHVIGLFSLFAETWSHTLSEAWSAGVPVVATRLGALAERVSAQAAGWLVDPEDPESILQLLRSLPEQREDWEVKAQRARSWHSRRLEAMAADYLSLYQRLLQQPAPVKVQDA